jgi:beta-glucan synthesis-associated protein KRE6
MLGLANFQAQDFEHMKFPAQMLVDYVRVYQRTDVTNGVGCDPPQRPTANYINKYAVHIPSYEGPLIRSHLGT